MWKHRGDEGIPAALMPSTRAGEFWLSHAALLTRGSLSSFCGTQGVSRLSLFHLYQPHVQTDLRATSFR